MENQFFCIKNKDRYYNVYLWIIITTFLIYQTYITYLIKIS